MSEFFSPYDADRPLTLRCSCGRDHSAAEHQAEQASGQAIAELRRRAGTTDFEAYSREFIEATLVKALFRAVPSNCLIEDESQGVVSPTCFLAQALDAGALEMVFGAGE